MILDGGACAVGIESTILDFSRDVPEILRPGAITPRTSRASSAAGRRCRNESVAKPLPARAGSAATRPISRKPPPPTPRRCSPTARLRRTRRPLRPAHPAPGRAPLLADEAAALAGEGDRVAVLAHSTSDPRDARLSWRSLPADPTAYAQGLYASLRALDGVGADFILIEGAPRRPGWRAVADRLAARSVAQAARRHEPAAMGSCKRLVTLNPHGSRRGFHFCRRVSIMRALSGADEARSWESAAFCQRSAGSSILCPPRTLPKLNRESLETPMKSRFRWAFYPEKSEKVYGGRAKVVQLGYEAKATVLPGWR